MTGYMAVFATGVFVLAAVYGLFVAKQHGNQLWIARFAYSRFVARLAVLGMALIAVGTLLLLEALLDLGDGAVSIWETGTGGKNLVQIHPRPICFDTVR